MCGRINVSDHAGVQALLDQLGISLDASAFHPRHNIAPSADILVACNALNSDRPDLAVMNWGIVPAWAHNKPGTRPLINARIESAWDKPSFRKLVAHTRGIVPVTGFYEWKQLGASKQPYFIRAAGKRALALAAIYQLTRDGSMEVAILTQEASGEMKRIHHRQPVMLAPDSMQAWLVEDNREQLEALTIDQQPLPLDMIEVSPYVNNAANEGEDCIKPAASA